MKYLFIFFCLTLFNQSFGDTGYYIEDYLKGGTVIPVSNNSIQMVSEIVVYTNNQFHAVFYFSNCTSLTQDVIMGFPMTGSLDKFFNDGERPVKIDRELYNNIKTYHKFKAFICDKETVTVLKKIKKITNKEYNTAFTWHVNFKPYQYITISNTYYQAPDREQYHWTRPNTYSLKYFLKSGSSWLGNIVQADFYYYIDKLRYYRMMSYPFYGERLLIAYGIYDICPTNNMTITKYSNTYLIKWHFDNLKPDFNISLLWSERSFNIENAIWNLKVNNRNDYIYEPYNEIFSNDNFRRNEKIDLYDQFQNKELFSNFIRSLYEDIINKSSEYSDERIIPYNLFIIHCIYASYNYNFKDEIWNKFFKQFNWFTPINKNIEFNDEENKIIRDLKSMNNALYHNILTNHVISSNELEFMDKKYLVNIINNIFSFLTNNTNHISMDINKKENEVIEKTGILSMFNNNKNNKQKINEMKNKILDLRLKYKLYSISLVNIQSNKFILENINK